MGSSVVVLVKPDVVITTSVWAAPLTFCELLEQYPRSQPRERFAPLALGSASADQVREVVAE
ncbi:MAG TPA: hypothetical protein VIQ76_17520, partial [Propionibacteriaceae bacterium]